MINESNQKKIFFLIGTIAHGGAERACVNLANALSNEFDVTVGVGCNESDDDYELKKNIRVERLSFNYLHMRFWEGIKEYIKRIRSVRKLIKKHKIDIVIGVCTSNAERAILSCLGLKITVIAWEHSSYFAVKSRVKRLQRKLLYALSDHIVLLTSTDIKQYPRFLFRKITVIANAIELPKETSQRRILTNNSVVNLLHVGRLSPEKNQRELIQIFAKFNATCSRNCHLAILGDGDEKLSLQNQIQELKVDKQVSLLGFVKNVDDYYKSADAVLLTSHYEGLPMAILEAMSFGVPVVSYDCPTGPAEVILDGVNGYLIEQYEQDKFVDRLVHLYNIMNGIEYAKMKTAAIRTAEEYSAEALYKHWLKLFYNK